MRLGRGAGGDALWDARTLERAMNERWPIPDDIRADSIHRMHEIVNDPGAKKREWIAAVRALIAADARNLDQQRLDLIRNAVDPDSMARLLREALDRVDSGPVGGPDPADPG